MIPKPEIQAECRGADANAVAAADENAAEPLDAFVRLHLRRVRALVGQMVLNDAVADDLTQEVFLRAVRHADQFRGGAKISTWLYRIALNTTRTWLARRPTPADQGLSPRGEAELATSAPGPEQLAIDAELHGEIQTALAELPTHLREAIVLTVLQGLDGRQAADVAGCSRATLYWRVHQARRQLGRRLERFLS